MHLHSRFPMDQRIFHERRGLFDLEKAYESTWKFVIMRDLHNAGLRGRLPLFIESFLKNRQFHVRLGSSYSDLFDQEMGVLQAVSFQSLCSG